MFDNKKKKTNKSDKQKQNKKKQNEKLDHYKKIKDKCFQIYINSGVAEYDKIDETQEKNFVSIGYFQQLSDNLIDKFSFIYNMDQYSFQWKDKVQDLIKTIREVVKIMEKVKGEIRGLEVERQREQREKRNQDENTKELVIKQLQEKIAVLAEKEKNSQKQKDFIKRQTQQSYQNQLKQMRSQVQRNKQQIFQLKIKMNQLERQRQQMRQELEHERTLNQQLNKRLKKIQNSYFNDEVLWAQFGVNKQKQNKDNFQTKSNFIKNISAAISGKNQQKQNHVNLLNKTKFQQILTHPHLSSKIIQFLPIKSIATIFSLNKFTRFYLYKSAATIRTCFKAIINYKNYQIKYFSRHINYFQAICKKIPEQILQVAFYQYNVLKENIGGDFLSILGICSQIFEGKVSLENNNENSKTIKEYIDSKQLLHYITQQPSQQQAHLRIDKTLISQFYDERKNKKQKIMKQIQLMLTKININKNLYSIDEKILNQFYEDVVKNYTILFVLSKYLYEDSRNIQHLNIYLLGQLNEKLKHKMEKDYDWEDIRTELQSNKKIISYFNQKCTKYEQKIIQLNKEKVSGSLSRAKLQERMIGLQTKLLELNQSLQQKRNQIKLQKQKNCQIKNSYRVCRDKYNTLLNELKIVKDNIYLNLK